MMTGISTMTGIEFYSLFIKGKTFKFLLLGPVLLSLDLYVLNGLRSLSEKKKLLHKRKSITNYWIFSASIIASFFIFYFADIGFGLRFALLALFFLVLLFKVCFAFFLFLDDLRRSFILIFVKITKKRLPVTNGSQPHPYAIPRSEFLVKAGVLAGTLPLVGLKLKMENGLYEYQIKYQTLYLPNLPKAFNGLRIGQISDIHSGSLQDTKAVERGIEMLLREKTDMIFFTGDLVNVLSIEVDRWVGILKKVRAPLGVYSILGNHDYGDYAHHWPSPTAKGENFAAITALHKIIGWDLLRNENRRVKVDSEEIGILGVENWSEVSHFPKYGKMEPTVRNTNDLPVKLLLSHDPSHWRAEVLPKYPQIDVMFSGHTHGMQFGLQTSTFQWSPIQYIYKEWAGLYHEGKQQLYVNVGFGFLAVQGRVGILPEITIFELKAGTNPYVSNTVNG